MVQVATIDNDRYALTSAGTVRAWGGNKYGQLGTGTTGKGTNAPQQVHFRDRVRIAFLANTAPNWTAIAVDTTGQAWGWGWNGNGQLCTGETSVHDTPVEVPLTHVTAIAGAGDHSLIARTARSTPAVRMEEVTSA